MDRRLLTKTVLATVILALAGITVFAQMRADAFKPQRKDEIVYLPNQKLLMHFTAGMNSIVADLLWLRCVQYTGVEIKESHNFAWLKQMLNTIVKMDPHFADVYRYGGFSSHRSRQMTALGWTCCSAGSWRAQTSGRCPMKRP
jgi:hypothetical protein